MTKVGNDSADWRDTAPDSPLAVFRAKQATCYRDVPELSPLRQLWRLCFWSVNPHTSFSGFSVLLAIHNSQALRVGDGSKDRVRVEMEESMRARRYHEARMHAGVELMINE